MPFASSHRPFAYRSPHHLHGAGHAGATEARLRRRTAKHDALMQGKEAWALIGKMDREGRGEECFEGDLVCTEAGRKEMGESLIEEEGERTVLEGWGREKATGCGANRIVGWWETWRRLQLDHGL